MSLEGYKRIRTIGKGAFGTAILYCKVTSGILVVLKEVNMMELTESEKTMALNEVKILSSLCHPNIIQYLGSFEEDGVLMIEMEYADGGTLAQFISQSSQLKERDILFLFCQCVSAIEYMHDNLILHRDLKTANVFLTKTKLIKVGDFGISKVMTTKRQAQTVVGTPYYISPEMCEGKQYDTKSDVWALGCILHEMACLRKTFHGENLSAVVNNIITVSFTPLPHIYSDGLKGLVTNLLQKDPSLRPNATEILIQAQTLLVQAEKIPVAQKSIRSVLYQVIGNRLSFSCTPIPLPPTLEIMKVAASKTHYITVSRDNIVHTWGEGKQGQLGHGEETVWLQNPTVVQSLVDKNIVDVAAGDGFSVFLNGSGPVLTCGNGTYGCLGQGDSKSTPTPQVVGKLINEKIKQVACGDYHCAVLSQAGDLFTWGRGQWGQLGTGFENNSYEPVRIKLRVRDAIKSVHCGPDCTALITDSGCVYVCGCNKYRKLGLRQPWLQICGQKIIIQEKVLRFRELNDTKMWQVVSLSLGCNHSAALTSCGRVITMGSNTKFQLGHSSIKPGVVISLDDKIAKHISCGPTFTVMTSIHNVLYFWGTRCFSWEANMTSMNFECREVTDGPEEILALYASSAQIAQGEILTAKHAISLTDGVLLLVDTTVPLILPAEEETNHQNRDYDTIGTIPKWVSAELTQAKHYWKQ